MPDWKRIVGTSATISLTIQFLVGIQVCAQFYQKKTTGDTSGLTFLVGVVMTFIWFSYGSLIEDVSIMVVNLVGLVLQVVYSLVFLAYSPDKCESVRRLVVTLILVMTIETCILLEDDIHTAKTRLGLLCSSLTVLYCSAPLASLQHVCSTHTTQSLPFYLILATAAVAAQWSLYGVIIQDMVVIIPNIVGCCVALAQLTLFCVFPHSHTDTYTQLHTQA